MSSQQISTGTRVAILSTNGTGNVTGHGKVITVMAGNLYVVERDNGRKVAVNGLILKAA